MSVARPSARRFLLIACAGVVAVVSALGVFIPAYLVFAADASARQVLQSRSGEQVALDIALPLAADGEPSAHQDASEPADDAIATAISMQFRTPRGEIPLILSRAVVLGAVSFDQSHAIDVEVAAIPALADAATLEAGRWQVSAGEASVQADAAASLGISVGDTIQVADTPLTVTGTWRLERPRDGRWFALPSLASGVDGLAFGPIMVDEKTLTEIARAAAAPATVHWTIVPDADRITAAELNASIQSWRGVRNAIETAGVDVADMEVAGRLLPTALEVRAQSAAIATALPLAMSVVIVVGIVILLEIVRLFTGMRMGEVALLWARGAGTRRLVRDAVTEVAPAVIAGAVIGAVAALAGLYALTGSTAYFSDPAGWVTVPAVTALAVIAGAAVRTAAEVRTLDAPARRVDPRLATTVQVVAGATLIALAALAGWQLVRYDDPVMSEQSAGEVDPLTVLAPALVLIAIIVALAVVTLLVRAPIERAARRSVGAVGSLVARGLTRRRAFAVMPIVLCALAIGQLVVAAGYAQTAHDGVQTAAAASQGTALRVSGWPGELTEPVVAAAADAPGVTGVAPVTRQSTSVSAQSVSLIAIAAPALRAVVAPGLPEIVRAAEAIMPEQLAGLSLPNGRDAEVALSWQDGPDSAEVSLVLTDEWGRTVRTPPVAASPDAGGTVVARVRIPDAGTRASLPWRVMAIDVTGAQPAAGDPDAAGGDAGRASMLTIQSLAVDGAAIELGREWGAVQLSDFPWPLDAVSGEAAVVAPPGVSALRLVPAPFGAAPVVVSESFAHLTGISVGDIVPVLLDGAVGPQLFPVARVIPAIPGADDPVSAMVDLRALVAVRLMHHLDPGTPEQLWLAVADPSAVQIADVRDALPAGLLIDGTAVVRWQASAAVSLALWIGAIATAVLALGALIAFVLAQARSRAVETTAMRTIGMRARTQARVQVAELSIACALGALFGAIAGAVVAGVLIPAIVRSALPHGGIGTVSPAIDGAALTLGIAVLVLSLAAVVLWAGMRVRRGDSIPMHGWMRGGRGGMPGGKRSRA